MNKPSSARIAVVVWSSYFRPAADGVVQSTHRTLLAAAKAAKRIEVSEGWSVSLRISGTDEQIKAAGIKSTYAGRSMFVDQDHNYFDVIVLAA